METIAIQNIKGGVGKTTTTVHLAAGILEQESKARVLIIDLDQQASIKSYFRLKLKDSDSDVFDFVISGSEYRSCLQTVQIRSNNQCKFDVMLSSKKLAEAEVRLTAFPRREETLRLRFEEQHIENDYDYILFDCPPTLNLLTYNALLMSKHLIIPCGMDYLSVVGVQTITENISMVEKYFKTRPNIIGVLPTFYDKRTSISDVVIGELRKGAGSLFPILDPIRIDTKLKNAQIRKLTVFEYDTNARSSEDYRKFSKRVLDSIASFNKQKTKKTMIVADSDQRRPEATT